MGGFLQEQETNQTVIVKVNLQHLKLDRDRSNPLKSRKLKTAYFSLWAKAIWSSGMQDGKIGNRLLRELFDLAGWDRNCI